MKNRNILAYFIKNLGVVVGLVLIWRGVWYTLDFADYLFLGNDHIYTAVGGIIAGLLLLYLPDKDLKEISKL